MDFLIPAENFAQTMADTVEPYLAARKEELRVGRLYCARYLADAPRGVVLISHGFTETAEKYLEPIYYFVTQGYSVWAPEHCGHGRSYRLTDDLSLVHIDRYGRYVEDLLTVAARARGASEGLPLYLYAHSMGGGVGAAALAAAPGRFRKAVLTSPMIRPLTGSVPWPLAKCLAALLSRTGKAVSYVPGGHPFDGSERFEDSASTCQARFDYYQAKRNAEPLYQMSAASCGWLHEMAKLNRYLMKDAWRRIMTPLLVFQADNDAFVSAKAQEKFVSRVDDAGNAPAHFIHMDGTRHEIFNAEDEVLAQYWGYIFHFLETK